MKKILNIQTNFKSKNDVLEYVQSGFLKKRVFQNLISLNPENFVQATKNEEFRKVVETSQMHISDGVGVVIASMLLGIPAPERVTGVDLMEALCKVANKHSLSVVLIGGRPNLAERVAKCQNEHYSSTNFYGLQGFKDIHNPTQIETERVFSIVAARKPSFVFVAFGSPAQELWIDANHAQFSESLCMGVGGAFDFLSGDIPRAPKILRQMGLEWLFRLIRQPWRIKRQLSLVTFIYLVLKQKLTNTP